MHHNALQYGLLASIQSAVYVKRRKGRKEGKKERKERERKKERGKERKKEKTSKLPRLM
jgi:hypothetical protein